MAYYNQLKTIQVNSAYHSNRITQIDVPKKSLKNNLRLAGVGCYRVGGDATTAFPATSGCLSLIQSITLFNDNVEIDSVRNAHVLYAFTQSLGDNPHSYSVEAPLTSNHLGWKLTNSLIIDTRTDGSLLQAIEAHAQKNLISLSKLLSFFRTAVVNGSKMVDIPADKLNLRLQIEWNTDVNQFGGLAPTSVVILEPYLI